jgi:hypothetical protein
VVVLAITGGFAICAWSAVEQWGNGGGDDAYTYRDYVQWLDKQHRIPRRDQNYEYALPVGVPAVGVLVQRAFGTPNLDNPSSPPLQALPKLLRRLLWLGLLIGGGFAIARARPLQPRWLIGIGAWIAAGGWAAAYVWAAANNEWWLPLVLISYVAGVLLVPATALLAHEVWPDWRWASPLGATSAVLMPVVLASTLYFHPDPPFALLCVLAVALCLRALRTGPTVLFGIAMGVVLGLAALARQSWPVVAISLAAAAVLVARKRALPFLGAAAGAMLVIAGWWWYQQWERYSNPIQANLNRPGYMLDHQPFSFFVSFPSQLISHPRAPYFENALLPRFHAYLWSDWGGGYHHWGETKRFATLLASTQSVLGFGGDALVLGGVAFIGLPAMWRRRDSAFVVLTTLFILAWGAYITTLVRFPQKGGDPIKVHYLLFLAPVSAVFAIAAARALVRRGGWQRLVLYAWLALYSLSWALTFATAF